MKQVSFQSVMDNANSVIRNIVMFLNLEGSIRSV